MGGTCSSCPVGIRLSNEKSVELLSMNGTRLCSLPDLPGARTHHSLNGLVSCGGGHSLGKSCITFDAGKWKKTHTLRQRRVCLTGWASPRGVLLMGGYYTYGYSSLLATELLTDNGGTTQSFNLVNFRR